MAIDLNTALFLQQAKADGCSFAATATLGHQSLFLRPESFAEHFAGCGEYPCDRYADRFLQAAFGAKEVTSFDASNYEDATVVHDMNAPIAAEWHDRFDAVIEMGSLEHIFNFPVAIENLMRMTKVGGHLFIVCPANNYFGHGFYQFSSDLFHRLLCAENGFALERMYVFEHRYCGVEMGVSGPWHEVKDPGAIGGRTLVIGDRPMLMMTRARRIAAQAGILKVPQQSDYTALWTGAPTRQSQVEAATASAGGSRDTARQLLQKFPALYRWITRQRFHRLRERQRATEHTLRNTEHFRETALRGDLPVS